MNAASAPPSVADWTSLHLAYQGDLDRLLLGVVAPAVRRWRRQGCLEGWFFVRHGLGGPHLRLRLRGPGPKGGWAADLAPRLADFGARCPPDRPLPESILRQRNRVILANDAAERRAFGEEGEVFPALGCFERPFLPDIDRFGGADLWPQALERFEGCSEAALERLEALQGLSRSRQLLPLWDELVRRAVGLVTAADELAALFAWAAPPPGSAFVAPAEKGRQLLLQRASFFQRRLLEVITEAASAGHRTALPAASGTAVRRSHLHMAANRLGVANREEAYLGGLLRATWETLEAGQQDAIAALLQGRADAVGREMETA